MWEPAFWKLPTFVTSLAINTNVVTLVQVRDIMAQLPNLDDLAVYGTLANEDGRTLSGIGTVLKGRFSGRLMLHYPCAGEDVTKMLSEIPSGLCFAKLNIFCTRNSLHSLAVRLAEVCGKTLIKLSHTVSPQCKSCPFP